MGSRQASQVKLSYVSMGDKHIEFSTDSTRTEPQASRNSYNFTCNLFDKCSEIESMTTCPILEIKWRACA